MFMSVWGIFGIVNYTHMHSTEDKWFQYSMLGCVIWSFLTAMCCYILIIIASMVCFMGGLFYHSMPEHQQEVTIGDAENGERVNFQRDEMMKKLLEWATDNFLGVKKPDGPMNEGLANALGSFMQPKSPLKKNTGEKGEVDEERRALNPAEEGGQDFMGGLLNAVKKEFKSG